MNKPTKFEIMRKNRPLAARRMRDAAEAAAAAERRRLPLEDAGFRAVCRKRFDAFIAAGMPGYRY